MRIFGWLFGKKNTSASKKEVVQKKEKKKDNSDDNFADYLHQPSERSESEVSGLDTNQKLIAYTIFPKLKGLNFKKINLEIEQNFQKQLCDNIDGDWYFIQSHIMYLAKAFSKETFEKSLKLLLENNNIKYDEYNVENEIKKWKGKGFVIENPPKLNGVNLIFITNESLIHTSHTELSKTNLSDEIQLPKKCKINGINHLYDGNDLMKKSKDPLNDLFNVPMLQKDESDGQFYILIINPNLKPAKLIIDSIVDKNGGKEKFIFNEEINNSWFHTYSGDGAEGSNFTIGYLEKHKTVRINFRKTVSIEELCQAFHNNVAKGQYKLALLNIEQAINLDKDNAIHYYNKGTLLYKLERDEEAIPCLEKAISLKSGKITIQEQTFEFEPGHAHFNLAMLYFHTGNYKESRKHAEMSEKMKYGLDDLKQLYKELENLDNSI
jgi:tetratricopeptide (TPR) repeat protein